ncbi:hypothetical protein FBU30_001666 [Linnemannia zychae]|nr:hypothetical protein FBU30_001666 [Linnemannia zychae]
MHKSLLLFSALAFAEAAFAAFAVTVYNNDGSYGAILDAQDGQRICYCVSATQTAKIIGTSGGDVKLFSKSDCSGNYANGSGITTYNAQWVNSISVGESGIPSTWGIHGQRCNWYPTN